MAGRFAGPGRRTASAAGTADDVGIVVAIWGETFGAEIGYQADM